MARSAPGPRTRRASLIIAAIVGGVILLIAAVGVYGLITGPPDHRTDTQAPATSDPDDVAPPPIRYVPSIPDTTDAETFATRVAHALFTWDTRSPLTPNDYREPLLQVADPSGHETNGLLTDLNAHFPSAEVWVGLQAYETRQWLDLDEVVIPDMWADAVAAGGDAIADGTVAYTITGTRQRAGVWHDQPETSAHPVAFTLFLTCPPDGEPCYLLRLSRLGEPLQ